VPSILYYILVSEMLCHQKLFPHFVNMFVLLAKFDYRNRDRVFMLLIKLKFVLWSQKFDCTLSCANLRSILYVGESKCFLYFLSLCLHVYYLPNCFLFGDVICAIFLQSRNFIKELIHSGAATEGATNLKC